MVSATLTKPAVDALQTFGELYRNEAGHEVWRIRNTDNSVYAENVASDFDAQWLAEQMGSVS